MPNTPLGKFRNVIFCEDIRTEGGNKKSLMGIVSGDLLAAEMPARIQMAFYIEYENDPDKKEPESLNISLWRGDEHVAHVEAFTNLSQPMTNLVLPRTIMAFPEATTFRLTVSIDGGEEIELMRKHVSLATSLDASGQPLLSSQSPNDASSKALPPAPSRPKRPTRKRLI